MVGQRDWKNMVAQGEEKTHPDAVRGFSRESTPSNVPVITVGRMWELWECVVQWLSQEPCPPLTEIIGWLQRWLGCSCGLIKLDKWLKIGSFTVKGVSNKIPKISQVCYLCSFLDSQLDRGFSHTGMQSFPSHIHGFAPFCPVSPPQMETQLSPDPSTFIINEHFFVQLCA